MRDDTLRALKQSQSISMGRAIVGIVFIIGFVIFLIAKAAMAGAKAAYETVFDPAAKDRRTLEFLELCMLRVNHAMHEHYRGGGPALANAIQQLTPTVQMMCLDRGYRVDSAMARAVVCDAIVRGGHATRDEVARALA